MSNKNVTKNEALSIEEAAKHEYLINTRGYTLLPGFLDLAQTRILKQLMEQAIYRFKPVPGVERSYQDQYQIHDLMVQYLDFARLLEDYRLQQLIQPHLGLHWVMYAATSSSIPPHGVNYANRLHVDSPRFCQNYLFNIGVIWALDDCTISNGGALKILAGSQHCEIMPHPSVFEDNCDQITCKEGSLIVFNARAAHKTCQNITDRWNHSMTLNACRSFMKQRMDWVRFIPAEISSQLNHQARRIIGFDTRVPENLDQFFLPEERRLYKSNQG